MADRVEDLEAVVESLVRVVKWNSEHDVGDAILYDRIGDTHGAGQTVGAAYVYGTQAVVPAKVHDQHVAQVVTVRLERIND